MNKVRIILLSVIMYIRSKRSVSRPEWVVNNPNMHKITIALACLLAIATASLVPGWKDKKVVGKYIFEFEKNFVM